MLLKDKTMLITGATGGIGEAIVLKAAVEGAHIFIHYHNNKEKAALLEKKVKSLGRKAAVHQADVSVPAEVESMFKAFFSVFPSLDILINNAGISYHKHFLEMEVEEWQKMMDLNLNSYFLCARIAARHMAKQKYGKIINNSSQLEFFARPNLTHYTTTKSGIGGFTRALSYDLAPYNIQVNNVCPGVIETEILGDKMKTDHAFRDSVLRMIPAGRLGKPEEVADLFIFLGSSKADYITGASFIIDGGATASRT